MFDYRRVLRPSLNPLKLAFYPTKSGMKVEKCSLKAGYDMTYQPRALGINGVSISAMRVYRWGMDSNEYCQHMPHKKKKDTKTAEGFVSSLLSMSVSDGFCRLFWIFPCANPWSSAEDRVMQVSKVCRAMGGRSRAAENLYEWPERTRTLSFTMDKRWFL